MQFLRHVPRKIVIAILLVVMYVLAWGISSIVAEKADQSYSNAWFVNDEATAAASGTRELIKTQCSDKRARALQWRPRQLTGIDGTEKAFNATPFIWVIWGNIHKIRQDTSIVEKNTLDNMVYIDQATSDFLTFPH